MKSRIPLKGFLSLQLGIVAVIPVITIAVLIWFLVMPLIQDRVGLKHQTMAQSIAGQVSAYLNGGERQLKALAEYLREEHTLTAQGRRSLLDAQCGSGELFEALFIVDDQENSIQTVGLARSLRSKWADYKGLDLSGFGFVRHAKEQNQTVWSRTFPSTVTSRMAVALTVPLANDHIIGEITLDNLSEFIADLPVESDLVTFIIDGQGRIVASSPKQHLGEVLNFFLHSADETDGRTLYPSDFFELKGERMLGTLVAMDGPDWKVLVTQPTQNALKPIWDTFRLITIGLIIALGLAIMFSWFQAGHLSGLFQTYAQKAKSIADGHYALPWPKAGTKEFFQLGQSLQRMAEKISRRERALIDSERRLRELTANVPGVVIQFRSTLDHIFSNEFLSAKMAEIFGLEPDSETIVEEFFRHIPDEDKDAYAASMRTAIDTVGPWVYEGRFNRPDGETIWFSGHAMPQEEGDSIVYYGILTDITQRKQTEDALRLNQFIFDKAPIGIWRMGGAGEVLDVNEQALASLGYTWEELSRLTVFDFAPGFGPDDWNSGTAILNEGKARGVEALHQRKSGEIFPVQVLEELMCFEDKRFRVAFVLDITERKRMGQALKESEERLDLALKCANEGIWDWQIEQDTLFLDARYYTMAGYRPNEFPASYDEIFKRCHKDDLERVSSAIDRSISGELDAFETEFRFLRKDGEYMWIQAKGEIVAWDDDGKPTRFIGTNADIDKRKKAEEALRENEQLLNNILESMNEGVVVIDHEFKYQRFNTGMEKIASIPRQAVLGKIPWEVFPYVKDSAIEKGMREAMKGNESSGIEMQFSLPHNEKAWFRGSYSSLKDEDGHVNGVVGVFSDITRNKKDEEALRRLQNYLSNIIDSMPSILVAVDRDGNVTQWNSKTEQATGLHFEQALSQPLSEVFPRLSDEMERIKTSIRDRRVISAPKVPCKTKDEARFEDITIFPLVANGVEGAVIRVDDVTERVRLEEMMIQSEKMLSVGGLAAGMAHEINNPLAGMLQTAGVMANRLSTKFKIPANRSAAEAAGTTMEAIEQFMTVRGIHRMLDTINESGQRAATIVNNVLSFARKSDAAVSSHHLAELLDKSEQLAATDYDLKKKYDFKKINIQKDYAPDLPVVPCEGPKIQQVLLNILRNGAQAMQAEGTQAPRFIFRTRFETDHNMAVMEIEDNGPGMDEQTRKRVFEPFFTTKPVGVGTGLGLSVSYFIITENHHGDMAVVSSPGAGAKFIVRLPIKGPNHQGENL